MNRSCNHWCTGITAMVMLALPAMGTIDKDADEMSDVWEGKYGFSITGSATSDEDPGADPDGDGWTNLQESMAGTDPGSSEMPEGVLKTQIAQNPSLTGVFPVSWETTPGKYYTLWVSTELDIWTPVGTAMLGDGTPIEMAVSSSGSKLFWRTTAADQDSDGDGLSDFEEWLVGTDSHKTDTDGDGVSYAGEVEQGKSPTDPNDTPTADWFTLVGDKPMDVVKSETRLFTVKKGETRVFVLGTQSDEYPVYTGSPSIFNDTLEWQITPGSGTAITGSINVNDRDFDWALDGANNVTLNGLEPVHVEAVKVIQAPATSDLVVTVTLKGTNISDGTRPSRLIVGVLPVKNVPDENMIDVIGDMVPSNKGVGGERHFVTPQKTTALNQQYLKLKALGLEPAWITAGDPNQLVEWATGVGMAADSDVLKWKVDRVSAGQIVARIRTIEKYSSEEAAKLNVWVTWATPFAQNNPSSGSTPGMRNPSDTVTPSGTPVLLQRGELYVKFHGRPVVTRTNPIG